MDSRPVAHSRLPLGALFAFYLPAAAVLAAVAIVSVATGRPVSSFTRDPAAVAGTGATIGLISNLGILCWAGSVGLCVLTAATLRWSRGASGGSGFVFVLGLLGLLLLLDDLLMIHEKLSEYQIVRERFTMGFYVLLTGVILIVFRRRVYESPFFLLVLAGCCFGVSLAADAMPETRLPVHHLIEDGAKFLGIAGWLGYCGTYCYRLLTWSMQRPAGGDSPG